MANVLWLNWSGGGNLPPSLGVARVLTERGHRVSFAGRPEMVARVERAGFRAIELTRAYEQAAAYPDRWLPRAASYLTSPAVAEQIRALLSSENPDLVVVDQMFPVALLEAARFEGPTVAVCHTCVWRGLEMWRKVFRMFADLRAEAGFDPIPADLESLWMAQDKMIVTTLKSLDDAPGQLGEAHKLRHVGPSLERERHGARVALPWPGDDPTPLVLVSFSTMPEQGSVEKFQNAIDALATLPVHGVVTVGDSVDPSALKPAQNVVVFATADHDDLMRRAALVMTHGGHGTFMRALTHGLPMVVIPGFASDQPVNAAAAQAWGVARSLPGNATAEMMRAAVREVLASPSFREAASATSGQLAGIDGAKNAADEIEQLLSESLKKAS
ncbi:MAG: nucleotide disphospho-sugar-binding domain-containing protein [Roseiarcus sp.]